MTEQSGPALPNGYRLHRYQAVASTMDEARGIAAAGPRVPHVIWAAEQKAGRGRRGRDWVSPPGNLYLTIAFPVDQPPEEAAQFSFLAGLALYDAIRAILAQNPPDLSLKWPNDVLIDGAKVAGILLELTPNADWLLIGTGVNIASAPEGMPYTVDRLQSFDSALQPGPLLEQYVAALDRWRGLWLAQGFPAVRETWIDRAAGLGQPVSVALPGGTENGVFTGLDETGALLLKLPSGLTTTVHAGDVILTQGD